MLLPTEQTAPNGSPHSACKLCAHSPCRFCLTHTSVNQCFCQRIASSKANDLTMSATMFVRTQFLPPPPPRPPPLCLTSLPSWHLGKVASAASWAQVRLCAFACLRCCPQSAEHHGHTAHKTNGHVHLHSCRLYHANRRQQQPSRLHARRRLRAPQPTFALGQRGPNGLPCARLAPAPPRPWRRHAPAPSPLLRCLSGWAPHGHA